MSISNIETDVNNLRIANCNHVFGREDLCTYLENFNTAKIICPQEGCTQLISESLVLKCLSNAQIEKYEGLCHSTNVENFLIKLRQNRISQNLVLNPKKSNCENCENFLLPREGIKLRSCEHNFCRVCLDSHVKDANILPSLSCLKCEKSLKCRECRELIGDKKLKDLCLAAVENHFYHCHTPDCTSMWHVEVYEGSHECEQCHKVNCLSCNDIHEGRTCSQYKQTPSYKQRQVYEQLLEKNKSISCFNCKNIIIKNGGCGALQCNICNKQVCAFTGKEIGPNGCQCRKNNKCHKDCNKGCIPEGKGEYKELLKNYFNNEDSRPAASSESSCSII